MTAPLLILLPGMDGTGDLFAPLLAVLPTSLDRLVLTYPARQRCSYDALLQRIREQIPPRRPLILLAESFSGPLAIRYATMNRDRVQALILCASFVRSPIPRRLGRLLAMPLLFRRTPPQFAIRLLLTGRSSPSSLVRLVQKTIASVGPAVLADRLRQVMCVDCTADLKACPAPIVYLHTTRDRLLGRRSLRALLALRPDIIVHHLNGPHLLLQTQPALAWQTIEPYLTRTGVTQSAVS